MKISQIMHAITLALCTHSIISMEAPSIETKKVITPYQRSASHETIKCACLCLAQKKINLDQFFDRILPVEVAQYIVKLAYDKDLYAYFCSKDRLTNFLHGNQHCATYAERNLSHMIRSLPNKAHAYATLQDLTCTTQLSNRQVVAGFIDGKITLFDTIHGLDVLLNPRIIDLGHTSSISALAGKIKNDCPSLLVGYHDGSVASLTLSESDRRLCRQLHSKPIACIAYTPLPNIYVFGSYDTIGIAQLRNDSYTKGTTIALGNEPMGEPPVITGIGTFNNCIVARTANNKYLTIAPYSNEDCQTMDYCKFSPLQAGCIYRMIQEKKLISDLQSPEFDDEIAAFRKLSSTMQKLFEARQE